MLSPRRTAELGLASALLVLVASVTILLHGRESLRANPQSTAADPAYPSSPLVVVTPHQSH